MTKFYQVQNLEFNGQKNFLEDANVIFKQRTTDYKNKKVIYTDILFNEEQFIEFKDKIRKNYKEVEIERLLEAFCDGGLKKTSASVVTHTAYACLLVENGQQIDEYSNTELQGTNQTAELKALLNALKMSISKAKKKDIIVITADSSYAIRGLYEYVHAWKKNGYKNSKNQIIENYDIWMEIFNKRELFDNIYFRHVKSHTKNEGEIFKYNDIVDKMCTKSIQDFITKQ